MENYELSIENHSNIVLYEHNEEKLTHAIERLNRHMRNKEHFRPYVFSIHVGETISGKDFSTKNIRMSYYKDCIIQNCNFTETGCAGSVFWETKFIDCTLDFSKFPSCDFRNCEIIFTKKTEVHSIDLNSSFFFGCSFNNIVFNAANFENITFKNGTFSNIKWHSVSVENALISKSNFTNMRFSSQNFDFLTFENISANNVVFPFPAMPFVINGLAYVYHTDDDIRFTSCSDGVKRISREEYLEQMEYFEEYYLNTDNFFPLANIYVGQGRIENAVKCIQAGLVQSIRSRNFRLLLYFCKILRTNLCFDIQHRKKLYNQILFEINKESLKNIDYEILSTYIPKIKEMLLESDNDPYIIVDIKTNINSDDYFEISKCISEYEKLILLTMGEKETHFIELRHNSDMNFIFQIASDPERLIIFLAALFQCIAFTYTGTRLLINEAKKIIQKWKNKRNNSSKSDNETNTIINNYNSIVINPTEFLSVGKIENINYTFFNVNNVEQIQSAYININKGITHSK